MIYLASPYSHPDRAVMEKRFIDVSRAAGKLKLQGITAFVPIAHCHWIDKLTPEAGTDFASWQAMDEEMIDHCKELWVLMLDGWADSTGVNAEIIYAHHKGYPVLYLDPVTLGFTETTIAAH